MLHRYYKSLVSLLTQRQFYLLLVLLGPLMLSLHWIAVRFPICFPDYIPLSIHHVEPDKLAVVFEHYGPRSRWGGMDQSDSRAWLLDMEAETLKPIGCPPEIGPSWTTFVGQDAKGNLIFEDRDAKGNLKYESGTGLTSYVSWNARTGETGSFDRSREIMHHNGYRQNFPFDWKMGTLPKSNPSVVSSRIIVHHEKEWLAWSGWPIVMQVRSVYPNEVLHTWKSPDRYISFGNLPEEVRFSANGQNVLFFTQDLRVIFVDKATGKVLRHIQPRFWLPLFAVSLGMATLVWLICWIRVSVRSGVSLWVDEAMILAVVGTFLLWRINLSGNLYDKQRVAWFGVAALAIAFLTVVLNQTLTRKARLLFRCAPTILLILVAIHLQWQWMWMERHRGLAMERLRPDNILLGGLLVSPLILSSMIIHFFFFRKTREVRVESYPSPRGFSLIDMFGWMGLVALALSSLRLYYLDDWMRIPTWNSMIEMLCDGSVITVVSLLAYFLTAERCYLVFRLLGGCFLAVLITISAAYRLDWVDLSVNVITTTPFYLVASNCERLTAIALGSILVALPIGMRNAVASRHAITK